MMHSILLRVRWTVSKIDFKKLKKIMVIKLKLRIFREIVHFKMNNIVIICEQHTFLVPLKSEKDVLFCYTLLTAALIATHLPE